MACSGIPSSSACGRTSRRARFGARTAEKTDATLRNTVNIRLQFQICHPGRTQGRWESPFKVYEPSTETRCEGESLDFPKNKMESSE